MIGIQISSFFETAIDFTPLHLFQQVRTINHGEYKDALRSVMIPRMMMALSQSGENCHQAQLLEAAQHETRPVPARHFYCLFSFS